VALEALAAATARLHADVDARHAAMVREIDAAYDANVAGLQRELSAARAGAAELATMVATAEAALAACTASVAGSVMCVHVGRSVEASLQAAQCREPADSDWCRLAFEAACAEEGGDGVVLLGRLRTSSTAPAAVSDLCAVEACRVFLRLPGRVFVCVCVCVCVCAECAECAECMGKWQGNGGPSCVSALFFGSVLGLRPLCSWMWVRLGNWSCFVRLGSPCSGSAHSLGAHVVCFGAGASLRLCCLSMLSFCLVEVGGGGWFQRSCCW
jgi:hypothetical protein